MAWCDVWGNCVELDRLRKWRMARPAVLLALAAFAPLAIYAGFDGYLALNRQQADMAAQSVASARALSETIDREIVSGIDAAETLAESPVLDGGGVSKVFQEVAGRTRLRHDDWLMALVMTPEGRWLYSTEPGDDLKGRERAQEMASLQLAVRTQRAVAGDIVRGPRGRWGIPLRAPVVRDGKVVAVVTVVLMPQILNRRLEALRLPKAWVVAVVNSYGHIVARSLDGERSLGLPVNTEARAARARGGGGSYQGHTLEGADTQSAYWVSPSTGWSVHVGVPRMVYEAPLRQMLATMVAGLTVCLLLALALVILWIRDFEARRTQASAVEQATRIDALGRLTGGVAHDFNNLLTVIQGNAEILSRRLQGAAQAERPLAAIRIATDRAAKLTRQLLVFARGGPAEPTAVDLARKLEDLVGPMSQLVGGGVAIETMVDPGVPPVSVDPLQLEAALLNLAANARDAMNGAGALEIRLRRAGPWVSLAVRDEGPGFDPAVLARVFDPFFTTKPVGQGTGLGLSQVYGLVKGAGGRVEAANAPGGGGLVTLFFPPILGVAAVDPSAPAIPSQAPGPAAGMDLAAVLLVDDNDAVRTTTAAYLRECGLSVIEAPDAIQALQTLQTAEVQAVVSDIIMPGLDGIGLAETIKARWPVLPVLLVSGYSERVSDAQSRGFSVVAKPYSLPDLERRLRALVGGSASARRLSDPPPSSASMAAQRLDQFNTPRPG
jgi:signal transduction histidine kinase/ActR/RegA family two-component response regulator